MPHLCCNGRNKENDRFNEFRDLICAWPHTTVVNKYDQLANKMICFEEVIITKHAKNKHAEDKGVKLKSPTIAKIGLLASVRTHNRCWIAG